MDSLRLFSGGRLDVSAYLAGYGIDVHREVDISDGGKKWQLKECLFNPEHKNGDAALFQLASGGLAYKCFHDSCQQYAWADARNAIGPILPEHWIADTNRPTTAAPRVDRFQRSANGHGYSKIEPYDLQIVTTDDLLADTAELAFRVKDVMVHGQPCLIGGASKTLKTSLATDLAVSVASGAPFLGQFETDQAPVLFVSAESGKTVLRHTVERVCEAREIDPRGLPLFWSFRRPNLANTGHLDSLRRAVDQHRPRMVILDPAYLLILAGSGEASNLFAVGKILGQITDALEGADVTLVLLHHFKKGASIIRKGGEPADLTDFSYAAFAEWSRQWLLITRDAAYVPGSGRHALTLSVGGSAGHSGYWKLQIDEGQPEDPLRGRTWDVTVNAPVNSATAEANPLKEVIDKISNRIEPWSAWWLRKECGWWAKKTDRVINELLDAGLIRIHSMENGTARYVATPSLELDRL